jgi:hypothetical protein
MKVSISVVMAVMSKDVLFVGVLQFGRQSVCSWAAPKPLLRPCKKIGRWLVP